MINFILFLLGFVFAVWALVTEVHARTDRPRPSDPAAPPKQAQWAAPMSALQERITEEWRRWEKKGSSSGPTPTAGILAEMQAVEHRRWTYGAPASCSTSSYEAPRPEDQG